MTALDTAFVRARFPALATDWALLDNAGGSAPCRHAIDRVAAHMAERPVQLGATYPLSVEAAAAVDAGRAAAATLVGGAPREVVLGPSSTALVRRLARALRATWAEGDEVVVTNLDHETNIGPWRALEATGVVVREWRLRPETATLHVEDLEPLLNERTRLVAFTHCSNVVGGLLDVPATCARVRAAGALSCVDGVAYAPHRRVDAPALGADLYFFSAYKVYGPHVGVLWGREAVLDGLPSRNHAFLDDALPNKLEPGGTQYELVAGLPGVLDYVDEVDAHHFGADGADRDARLARTFDLFAAHEAEVVAPLLAFLDEHPRARLLGPASPDPAVRAPTVCFTVDGMRSSEVATRLEARRVAVRWGHFYSHGAVRDLGLLERDGIVRASLVHYDTHEEVARLVEGLGELLG